MVKWDKKVWDTLGMDQLADGEGFRFRITQKGAEREEVVA